MEKERMEDNEDLEKNSSDRDDGSHGCGSDDDRCFCRS